MAYDVHDLPFARESPHYHVELEKHRAELKTADEHVAGVAACARALVQAMRSVGTASSNLATMLDSTPAMFQAESVVAALAGVLMELASAEDVLAESLELSLEKPLETFRVDLHKVDDMKRALVGAENDAAAAAETLLHGDWRAVERDVLSSRVTLAGVVDERARFAAAKRRSAEKQRFALSRHVSSLQRTKGLVLAEVSVSSLCSLRAFYAQAGHAVSESAAHAAGAQGFIADACDRERKPWDYKMLKMSEILSGRYVSSEILNGSQTAVPHNVFKSPLLHLSAVLDAAEEAHRTHEMETDLNDLYSPISSPLPSDQTKRLEGFLYSQPVVQKGRVRNPAPGSWVRKWFILDDFALRSAKDQPTAVTAFVLSALMREPSNTSEAEATGTIETVAVADLLLSTVRACDEERCCFEIHSAHGAPLRLQAPGKGAYNRWVEALRDAISDQLAGGRASIGEEAAGDAQIPPMLPHGKMLRSFTPPLSGKPLSGEMTSSQSEPCLSTESLPKQTLREAYASQIRAIECANALCCDCGGARPEWCVINLGIVVCLGCSGVHRSMGTHISKVRSLQLDKLDDATCQLLLDCGNATVNAVFEATFVRPQSGFVICDFIKQKWRDKAFVLVSKNADDLLFEAAKTDDTVGALRAFANGAKADSRDASGRTPLHACAESDRAAVAQLLLLNGDAQKLASNVDFSGNTPLGEAIASQHKTLEKLLGHVANGPSR